MSWRAASTGQPVPFRLQVNVEDFRSVLAFQTCRFYPQMIDWLAGEIDALVHERGVPPGEIAILSPFLSDSLRFSIADRLVRAGIPVRSHRPSRGLHEEPAARCLLTLAALAHPAWRICPSPESVGSALMQAIDGLDLVRAHLLTEIVYRTRDKIPALTSFDQIRPEIQERISFALGQRYQALFEWIRAYQAGSPAGPGPFHQPAVWRSDFTARVWFPPQF